MERATVEIYERRGLAWVATHGTAGRRAEAEAFAERVVPGAPRLDLGCGAGRYLSHLGTPVVALDASTSMLGACRARHPDALYILGDVEHLPFARHSIGGAWSWMTHLHVPRHRLPLALWDLHRVLAVDSPFEIRVLEGDYEGDALPDDEVGGRFFAGWEPDRLVDVVTGAGFEVAQGSRRRLRRRGGSTGRAGPHAGRHRRARHAPPHLRGQSVVVLGRRRRRLRPSRQPLLGRGHGRGHRRLRPGRGGGPGGPRGGHDRLRQATHPHGRRSDGRGVPAPGSPGSSVWWRGSGPGRCASPACRGGATWSTPRQWPAPSPRVSAAARPM